MEPHDSLIEWDRDGTNSVLTGCFLRYIMKGSLDFHCSKLVLDPSTAAISVVPQDFGPDSFGSFGYFGPAVTLMKEFIDGQTARAMAARQHCCPGRLGAGPISDSKFVEGVIQFVIDYSTGEEHAAVHGPIDVIVADSTGRIKWVHRKPNCRPKDQVQLSRGTIKH